ncbi:AtpZ/AtpI family protein [Winogradskyella luteola]|uniref:AtpZ/AtpI family protein n=1 Tax=Winogradskyella luteola TaxID=2828330 RepID=A0A9X1F828_9FLAO|nr:AtpZ/AtpI family protein [Winogradskyella luteola]MBV7269192.1 AtpZ/AtpI family protein [Winogradskyella luteola]
MNQPNQNNQNNKSKPDKDQKDKLNTYARFSGIVVQMVVIICVGTFIGLKLDERFPNENNLYTLFFTLGFVIASIVFVIRRIIAASKDS